MMDEESKRGLTQDEMQRHAKTKQIKRFYKKAHVEPDGDYFAVQLDGKTLRTPARQAVLSPSREHAEAIAEEWRAQKNWIAPLTMPFSRLHNSLLDRLIGKHEEALEILLQLAGKDQLFYPSEQPERLSELENEAWLPVIHNFTKKYGEAPKQTRGLAPPEQSALYFSLWRERLAELPTMALGALQDIANLTNSMLLTGALLDGDIDFGTAWRAAHLDEDFQNSIWGIDQEASEVRAQRETEARAALKSLNFFLRNTKLTINFENHLNLKH